MRRTEQVAEVQGSSKRGCGTGEQRPGEMVQQLKALAAKSDNLSPILGTHTE